MGLTESMAMAPAASVSGFYLAHPRVDLLQRRQDRRRPVRDWAAPQLRCRPKGARALAEQLETLESCRSAARISDGRVQG